MTTITWVKTKDGRIANGGPRQYFAGVTKHCLFGVSKSKTPPHRKLDGLRQQGKTIIVTAERAEHSRKLGAMREMIERVSYPPRIELPAREEVEGWDAWGNEVGVG